MRFFKKQLFKQRFSLTGKFSTVVATELIVILLLLFFAILFWNIVCDETWKSCLGSQTYLRTLLIYCVIRPLLFSPFAILALMAGDAYGPLWGAIVTSGGSLLATTGLYFLGQFIGRKYVMSFLYRNLPFSFESFSKHSFKHIFFSRMIPFLPYDLFSFLYGVFHFRLSAVLLGSFVGTLPVAYLVPKLTIGLDHDYSLWGLFLAYLILTTVFFAAVFIWSQISGVNIFFRVRRFYREAVYELRQNNTIDRAFHYDASKAPIVLLYGFFSSRRAMVLLERRLQAIGHQVITFNLGGLLDVFFTKGVIEAAEFIDEKITTQMARYHFPKVHLVGFSKGGLVAIYYLLKLGGYKKCDKVITLGSPFAGAWQTYLAIFSPLGFFWKDVWQMRPNSEFLAELNKLEIPESVDIHCIYSRNDLVSRDEGGIYQNKTAQHRIHPIDMHHLDHYGFLTDKDVVQKIDEILNDGISNRMNTDEKEFLDV